MFAKDVVGCFCHITVKAVGQSVYFSDLIVKDEQWCKLPSYSCSVFKFLKTEFDPYVSLVFHPLEAESEGHHYKLMVTSDIGSWKTPGLCDVHN